MQASLLLRVREVRLDERYPARIFYVQLQSDRVPQPVDSLFRHCCLLSQRYAVHDLRNFVTCFSCVFLLYIFHDPVHLTPLSDSILYGWSKDYEFRIFRPRRRSVITRAIEYHRPHLQVRSVALGVMEEALAGFDQHAVICSRPSDEYPDRGRGRGWSCRRSRPGPGTCAWEGNAKRSSTPNWEGY
jgi:hypothetical protein